MTVTQFQILRRLVFATIGLVLIGYAAIFITQGMSVNLPPLLPAIVGISGAAILFGVGALSGKPISGAVFDELSKMEWNKALRFGYWFAVALYPVFGLLLARGYVDPKQAFAVMGTLTGGVPLLYYCWLDMRG